MPVAVIIHEGASCPPTRLFPCNARFLAHICEGAVAIVVVQNILAVIGNKEIVKTIIVVVADTDTLSPSGMRQAGFYRHIGESAVAIVLKQV